MKQSIQEKFAQLMGLVEAISDNYTAAGEVVVDLLDNDDVALRDISEATDISTHLLRDLDKAGRGANPLVFLTSGEAYRRLRRCDIPTINRVMREGGVEFAVVNAKGEADKEFRLLDIMSVGDCQQVFQNRTVATLTQQRAYLKRLASGSVASNGGRSKAKKPKKRWVVENGQVRFLDLDYFDALEIELVIKELRKK